MAKPKASLLHLHPSANLKWQSAEGVISLVHGTHQIPVGDIRSARVGPDADLQLQIPVRGIKCSFAAKIPVDRIRYAFAAQDAHLSNGARFGAVILTRDCFLEAAESKIICCADAQVKAIR
jgi:hypothetical protein